MKCAIAESYTHIGQAQIDKGEVRDRASVEHNREDEDHTGTPVREREKTRNHIRAYLVHQLERENWSTRVIHGYYLYIIALEYTTVSNSGLCTRGHNAIGCYCTLQNVLETRSRLSIVIQDNSPLGTKGMSLKRTIRKEQ